MLLKPYCGVGGGGEFYRKFQSVKEDVAIKDNSILFFKAST